MKQARKKKVNQLQDQLTTLTNTVTGLAQKVEELQETKQRVDEFLSEDMNELIKKYTNEYLTNNLGELTSTKVKKLVQPIKSQLNDRIKHVVEKMLSSIAFHLQTAKTSKQHQELTVEEFKAELAAKLAQKITMTPEEILAYDAIQASMSKESCKEAAGTHKRSRKLTQTTSNYFNQNSSTYISIWVSTTRGRRTLYQHW